MLATPLDAEDSCSRHTPIQQGGRLRPYCNVVTDPHTPNMLPLHEWAEHLNDSFYFRRFRHTVLRKADQSILPNYSSQANGCPPKKRAASTKPATMAAGWFC